MRRSIVLSASACIVAMVVLLFALLVGNGTPAGDPMVAQMPDKAPIFEKEVRSWCIDTCDGGDWKHEAHTAEFVMRPDGSLHFTSHVNYAACPRFEIPNGIGGWYFGATSEEFEAQATMTATWGAVPERTTIGVQPIDDSVRSNTDLMICEAVFVRGG